MTEEDKNQNIKENSQTRSVAGIPTSKIIIVAINLLILAAYTIYLSRDKEELNIIAEAFFIAIHFVLCLVTAIFVFRKELILSAILVILIGSSTCFMTFS